MAATRMRGVTLLSSLFLLPPFAIWALWIHVFTSYPGLSSFGRMQLFLDYFPALARDQDLLSGIVLLCSITAILLGLKAFTRSGGLTKVLCVTNIIMGALMVFVQALALL